MPAKRELSMRQLRHLLRLHHDGVSAREIGRRLGVARSTIQDNLKRAAAAGLAWPLADGVTDEALERQLFGRAGVAQGQRRRAEPDWAALARELKRPGVTMTILWEEYREVHSEGYGYSRFCDLLRGFERRLTPVMRQHHVAGEKAFVDYSGKRIGIADPSTGEIRKAKIFVGVLGASNLTYAEATWTQTLPDWTSAHVRMFRFFGGAPKLLVPDNLKSGVNKASFYDPEINRTYGAMAAHYSVGILPARPGKPRDKAKVEAGVRFAQTYILGRLQRGELAFGQHQAFLGDLGLERLEPFLHRLKIMALPDAADASRRDRMAELAKLVGDADLAISRLVQRKLDDDRFDLGRRAVLQDRLAPRQFLQRKFAAGVVKLLETVKAVAAIAHHLAGLADIAELLGQLQQPNLGADDLLFLGHRRCPFETPKPGAANPDHSAPGLGFRLSYDTNCQIKS